MTAGWKEEEEDEDVEEKLKKKSTVEGRGKLQSCQRRGKYISIEEGPEMGNECDIW